MCKDADTQFKIEFLDLLVIKNVQLLRKLKHKSTLMNLEGMIENHDRTSLILGLKRS